VFVDELGGFCVEKNVMSTHSSFCYSRFDVEVTDDEEDSRSQNRNYRHQQGCNLGNSNLPKRFRAADDPLSGFDDFDGTMGDRAYATRGSGIDPTIEGVERQPWQFNFKSRKANKKAEKCTDSDVLWSRGTLSLFSFIH
jgi:hypothetical protein